MRIKRKLMLVPFVGVIIFTSFFGAINVQKVASNEPLVTLVFKTNDDDVRISYGILLKQQLARLGIELEIYILDTPTYIAELTSFHDFDICYTAAINDPMNPFNENSQSWNESLNVFGEDLSYYYREGENRSIVNDRYLDVGLTAIPPDSQERIQHYFDWQQFYMYEICSMLPMFVPKSYSASWSNLEGFNLANGLLDSWGNLSWTSTHVGQTTEDELNIVSEETLDIHPFYTNEKEDPFLLSLTNDPLIWHHADGSFRPHLAKEVIFENATIMQIELREGIKWATDPVGNFTNEYLDIFDLYFTLYIQSTISDNTAKWNWIDEIEIIDNMTMKIHVDGNPSTPEKEPYIDCIKDLTLNILPEHYLNQTQLPDGISPDTTQLAWGTLYKDSLGTGLFELTDYTEGEGVVFTINPNSWWLNSSITSLFAYQGFNWNEYYGDFSNSPNILNIHFFSNQAEIISEYEAGNLDLIDITNISDEKFFEYRNNTNYQIYSQRTNEFGYFGFNLRVDRPAIGDITSCDIDPTISKGLALRKAIYYAINREEMNTFANKKEKDISHWPVSTNLETWLNPNIIRYDYDLDKAYNYMENAGFEYTATTPNNDGSFGILLISLFGLVILGTVVMGIFMVFLPQIVKKSEVNRMKREEKR